MSITTISCQGKAVNYQHRQNVLLIQLPSPSKAYQRLQRKKHLNFIAAM